MMGARDQYFNNVAIKYVHHIDFRMHGPFNILSSCRVNAKLGGVNWIVRNPALDEVVMSGPTMVIGPRLLHLHYDDSAHDQNANLYHKVPMSVILHLGY